MKLLNVKGVGFIALVIVVLVMSGVAKDATNLLSTANLELHVPTNSSTNENLDLTNKEVKLHVLSQAGEGSRTNASRDNKSATARLFQSVKSFFSGGNVLHLFNGTDLENFYPWLKDSGTYTDPDGVFSVEDGMIRISGQHEGFLATKGHFGDYKLVMEFKWGDATWYRHKSTRRNSGIFINAVGLDGLDMKSIEVQIAEPSPETKEGTGDVVLHGGSKMTVGNQTQSKPWDTFFRVNKKEVDVSSGAWNKMEVVMEGDQVRVNVNGHLAFEGRRATPTSGKILLQSNGAEMFIRRLDLYPIETNNLPILSLPGSGR